MSRTGGVVALVALVVLAGCAGFAGSDGETETPDTTPTPDATPTPTPEPTPTPTPEYDPALVAPDVERPGGIQLKTFADSEENALLRGNVTIYDEDGDAAREFSFDDEWNHSIEDLEPGTTYTVDVSMPEPWEMPPNEETFDPGQTDELAVFATPEFQQADSFEWNWRFIHGGYVDNETLEFIGREDFVDRDRQLIGGGIYDEGDWFQKNNELWVVEDPDRNESMTAYVDGEIQSRNFHKEWHEIEKTSRNPTYQPEFAPIRDGVFGIDNITLQYVDTRELNDSTVPEPLHVHPIPEQNEGREVHVFNVTLWGYSERAGGPYAFDEDSEARIHVDVETGHVLRWEAHERLSVGVGFYDYYFGMNPSIHVIDFYNHGDAELDPEDYPPFR